MTDEKILRFAECLEQAAIAGTLRTIVLYAPVDKSGELCKIKGNLRTIGGRRVVQMESSLTEGRVTHRNVPVNEVSDYFLSAFAAFRRADIMASSGDLSLMVSKKGNCVTMKSRQASDSSPPEDHAGNDRQKNHLLSGSEPFLRELGVSDSTGRVKDKMMPKFRQINRFCEYITEAAGRIGAAGTVYVSDLCCGKSYLSFAAYHTLSETIGLECEMHCVDLKASVIEYCSATAVACGYKGMHFYCCDISKYIPDHTPDIVISFMHAIQRPTLFLIMRYVMERKLFWRPHAVTAR